MSVGWLPSVKLRVFARLLNEVFGEMVYQVGSSLNSKEWRDVDVVVMMGPEKFYHWAGPHGMHGMQWQAVCAAFSALGRDLTGLPIDFKFQPIKHANEKHNKQRDAIGIRISPDYVESDCPAELASPFPTAEESLFSDKD